MQNKSTAISPFSEITAEQIQDWKAKYNVPLTEITVRAKPTQDEVDKAVSAHREQNGPAAPMPKVLGKIMARFIARRPSRTVMDLLSKYGAEKDTIAASKCIVSNCILGGDMEVLENDGGVYTEVLFKLRNLFETTEVELKNI